jgi:hypothetical protein
VGKPDGKRPLGSTRRKCEVNNKIILAILGGVIWTGLIWLRIGTGVRALVNAIMNTRIP